MSLFITFEGNECTGKSTQVALLCQWMEDRGIRFSNTKEPGCPIIFECVKIRNLLLDVTNNIVPTAELLLFLADRAQHVESFIKPSLDAGINIICDRFEDSTRVYQCARGISRFKIDTLNEFATSGLKPDLTFILDMPVEVVLKRLSSKSRDRMESSDEKFYHDVRHGFLKLTENINDDRFRLIDVSPPKTINEIHLEIVEHLSKKLYLGD